MPRIMQSLKVADETGTSKRQLTWALLVAVLVAIPVSYWALLASGYGHGGVSINAYRFVTLAQANGQFMERLSGNPVKSADWLTVAIMGLGAAKLLFLSFMRINYLWWPLHPVGFAMGYITYVGREWLSIFIGWACQTLLLHYGGATAFQRYRPLFLGLILGAMLVAGLWLIIDGFTGLRDHKLLY